MRLGTNIQHHRFCKVFAQIPKHGRHTFMSNPFKNHIVEFDYTHPRSTECTIGKNTFSLS